MMRRLLPVVLLLGLGVTAPSPSALPLITTGGSVGVPANDAVEDVQQSAQAKTAERSRGLSSPRATMTTFLAAMNDAREGNRQRLEDAVECLDLSEVAAMVRNEAGRLAGDLKTYLDKTERIDLQSIPQQVESRRWVYQRTPVGEVSMIRQDDGLWLFSPETIDSLPALLDSVRNKDFVKGLDNAGGAAPTLADWVRGRVPGWGLDRLLLLEVWQWFALLALALLGVFLDRLVRLILRFWLRKILIKSDKLRKQDALTDFEKPVGILAMALVWWVLLPLLHLPLVALAALLFASKLVAAFAGVWAAYKLVDLVSAHLMTVAKDTDTQLDDILVPMLRRALKILVVAFGVIFIAQNLDIDVTSLLAGLGIGGIAIALAAKDTVENLFGSVTVLTDRPFRIGDWVVIGEEEGTVEEIGFRSTRIRTFYNSLITVPNALLVRSAVDNLGQRRYRRFKTTIGVQYDTPPDRVDEFCEGIRELIRTQEHTRKDYFMVYLNEFSDSSLGILLYTFFETPDWPAELEARHTLMLEIIRLAHRLGVEFAFPTRTLHVASMPEAPAPSLPRAD